MKPLRRAELEKEHTRRRNESEAAHRELRELRPRLEKTEAELKALSAEHRELQKTHAEKIEVIGRLGRKLSEVSLENMSTRVEFIAYQEMHVAMAQRLGALEKAGNDLLEFLPSEATGRARYSKHARAAVAFREALKGSP